MKIPETPPTLSAEMKHWDGNLAEFLELISNPTIGAEDPKGRYLHWETLKYLQPPAGYTNTTYWLATKLARDKTSKKLPFQDKDSKPFQYSQTNSIVKGLLWASENSAGIISADAPFTNTKTQQVYLIHSLIEEAINSSQLEGASTTRRVAKELIQSGRMPKDHSETMILNNHKAMQFIRSMAQEALTPSIIFELHKILTIDTLIEEDEGKAGAFRSREDDICVFSKEGELLHIPPRADQLEQRLQLICDFANNIDDESTYIPPLIKAIIIHFMIGYDHPFVDGNGRTARALFYWMMVKEKFWLMEYISISRVIKKAPAKYMSAYLHTETDSNDMTYFIIHQLNVIKEAVTDLHLYLQKKAQQKKELEISLENSALYSKLNSRQCDILRHALKNPGTEYTIRNHQYFHGVTYQTARTDLLSLANDYDLLKKYKSGRTDMFLSPANLRELIDSYKSKS